MQSTILNPACSLLNIHRVILLWMMAGMVLTLGGCVSQQTYESARQEAQTRANELAQAQAEIQSLEQEREETHAANQRDERTLGSLKSELQNIRASLDQIRTTNQAKLTALQHRLDGLRARHQAMLKEISETKRYEKKVAALKAQQEEATATMPAGPEARMTTVDGLQQESRMVAVITPQPPQFVESLSPASPTAGSSPREVPAPPSLSPSTVTLPPTATVVAAAAPASAPAKKGPVTAATASATTNNSPAPSNQSWFSSMTGWLVSMFDWIWS